MSVIVFNLQVNRAVFRIFSTLLRFSFDSPSYKHSKLFMGIGLPIFSLIIILLPVEVNRQNISFLFIG